MNWFCDITPTVGKTVRFKIELAEDEQDALDIVQEMPPGTFVRNIFDGETLTMVNPAMIVTITVWKM